MAEYDLLVIGSGPGGYVAAIRGAQKGLKTAVVEKGHIGGCCLNVGCVPTKSLMHSAHLFRELRHGDRLGISAGDISIDIGKLYENKNATVKTLREGIEQLLKANKIDIYRGVAKITGEGTVSVDGAEPYALSAKNILIAIGGRPQRLPENLMQAGGVFTSDDILAEAPVDLKRVVIIGAGVIALEFASFYCDLGCEVTVVARSTVLRKMDREISQSITMVMKDRGVRFESGASVKAIEKIGDSLKCTFVQKDEDLVIECDGVIAAMGRTTGVDGLFSGMEPVETDESGAIIIDEHCRTGAPGVYAIGDCTSGSVQLAHAASAQGMNAVSHMIGEDEPMCIGAIPSCMYTDPEVAVVGLSAREAKTRGIPTKTGKYIMSVNSKSVLSYQDRGFIKVVFNAETDELIGAQLMCARATDMVGELTTAIANKLTPHELSKVVRPHPTFVEGVSEAVEDVENLAIHMMPKRI